MTWPTGAVIMNAPRSLSLSLSVPLSHSAIMHSFSPPSPSPIITSRSYNHSQLDTGDEDEESGRLDENEDDGSQCSSDLYSEEPFDLFGTRILYLFSRVPEITPTEPPPLLFRRRGGGFNRITELSLSGSDRNPNARTKYIWRSPRYLSNDVTRSALMLRYLGAHTSIPLPTVFSFSATDQVISDRYILMDLLPGVDLASLLDAISLSLSLRQRLEMAERVAELMADIHAIAIPGGEGLIGDICVEGGGGDGGDGTRKDQDQHQDRNRDRHQDHHKDKGDLVIKTFPHDHSLIHDSSSSPNSSDQSPSKPHTLRSFILARFRLFLDRARSRESEWLETVYLRLIAVTETLLDPDRLPSIDAACKSVFVHTDLVARNMLVQVEGDDDGEGDRVNGGEGDRVNGGEGDRVHGGEGDRVHGGEGDRVNGGEGDRVNGGGGDRVNVRPCGGLLDHRRNLEIASRSDIGPGPKRTTWSCSCSNDIKTVTVETSALSTTTPINSSRANALKITGVLDWDSVEAWPPLAAYVSPNWLWTPRPDRTNLSTSWIDESDQDPDEAITDMNPTDALVRTRFITSIENRIPGYMETIRQGRRVGIKRLIRFARSGLRGTWEESGVENLERLAEKITS